MNRVGIDLGGTKIEGVATDECFNIIDRMRVATPGDYTGILHAIRDMIAELHKSDAVIGVCAPGTAPADTGLIRNSNTQCLMGRPLRADLELLAGQKIAMENDANCFALAEAVMGAAKDYRTVFGVILGTGVGGGIIIDGKIHHGRAGIAGEWGHHTLHHNGIACYCGRSGCVEQYISGPALEKRWRELVGGGRKLRDIAGSMHEKNAQKWKDEFLDCFSSGLANVIDILDPDAIVLGGGVSNVEFLYDEGRDLTLQKVFGGMADTPILKNAMGDSAGVIGACMI